jgi:heat shock protein 5
LSQEEIERMVKEAEEFAEEDKVMKETIDARNALEGYAFSLKNSVNDKEKLGAKISEEDKETIEKAAKEVTDWLEEHPDAEKDEYAEKQKELEAVANPIMTKLYQAGGGGAGGAGGGDDDDIPDHDDL